MNIPLRRRARAVISPKRQGGNNDGVITCGAQLGEFGIPAESAWRLNTTKVLLRALVREHLQRRCERIVVATLGEQ